MDAVVDYAEALAISGASAQVTFPARAEDGSVVETKLLIGPASQIAVRDVSEHEHGHEFVDDDLAADFRERAREVRFGPDAPAGADHDPAEAAPLKWTDDF